MMHAADDCFSGSLRGLHLPNSLSEKAGTPLAVFLPCAVWRVLKLVSILGVPVFFALTFRKEGMVL